MRLLEEHELAHVGGAGVDTYEIRLPSGATWTSKLEANRTTTITIQGQGWAYQWNSGELITCHMLATGLGFTVGVLSRGNAAVGALVDGAVAYGCSYAFSRTDEDGDEFQ